MWSASSSRTSPAVLRRRHGILRSLRGWLDAAGFVEVEVPVLWHEVLPEEHIEPPRCDRGWLLPSPEIHMKRLLAEGHERIYALGPCFRSGERGRRHHPEFRMLEWYRAGADLDALARDVCGLVAAAAAAAGVERACWGGREAALTAGWDRRGVAEMFRRHANWDPVAAWDAERFTEDMATRVEPALGWPRPLLLDAWPAAEASLARLDPGDPRVARRLEAYVCGLELCNGFEELADAQLQRRRFEEVLERRRARGAPAADLPRGFLAALAHMPPAAGMALGVDRLVMLLLGEEHLDRVVAIPPDGGP